MSEHEKIERWSDKGRDPYSPTDPFSNLYVLTRNQASDLLDEWEDAQAMIRALEGLLDGYRAEFAAAMVYEGPPPPPAWTVIA